MLTGAFRVLVGYGRVLVEQLQALLEASVLFFLLFIGQPTCLVRRSCRIWGRMKKGSGDGRLGVGGVHVMGSFAVLTRKNPEKML